MASGTGKPDANRSIEPSDVSDTMVYLCGRSGRYVTGVTLPVDAGNAVK